MHPRLPARLASLVAVALGALAAPAAHAQLAVRAQTLHTMQRDPAGSFITFSPGVVIIAADGKISAVGPADSTPIPDGHTVLDAPVAVPGLIDARSAVGLSGMLNQRQDQDQLETSSPIQPELRALDAFNPLDPLVEWLRSFGITTLHTGHAPGELISGQTLLVKTTGRPVDEAALDTQAMIAATLGPEAQRSDSPGTRAKMMALLRQELIRTQEHLDKANALEKPQPDRPADAPADDESPAHPKPKARDLRREAFVEILQGTTPLLITANRAQDIDSVLRLKAEFPTVRIVLDMGSESYLRIDALKAAGIPVLIHPPMWRGWGETENASFETPAKLHAAGIPFAFQSSYEAYVPKTRVVLFEAAAAIAHGLPTDAALAAITIDAARILGIDARVGSLAPGKDADLALYSGDPFEYTTTCTAVIIDGRISTQPGR